MTSQPPPPKRKRGAPLGNTNAVTHGMYAVKHPYLQPVAYPHQIDLKQTVTLLIRLARRFFRHLPASWTKQEGYDFLLSFMQRTFDLAHLMACNNSFKYRDASIETILNTAAGVKSNQTAEPDKKPKGKRMLQ